MGVKDYDLNPDDNTQINGINIAEGCPPSGINNAIRQIMADVKEDSDAQDIAIEALEKKAETPASAEDLGPVKVGDGLTIGEDGTLSLDLVDGVDSTSTTQAATSNAVKTAYDKAVDAIEIDSSGYSSNQHWVRYKDGRQIIYSDWMESMNDTTVTFIKPFTTNPAMIGFDNANVPANMERRMKFTAITGTYFTTEDWAYGSVNKSGCWLAMGTWE